MKFYAIKEGFKAIFDPSDVIELAKRLIREYRTPLDIPEYTSEDLEKDLEYAQFWEDYISKIR
jgi:hypothetical protein